MLPHAGKRCGLVWSVAGSEADDVMALDDAGFMHAARQRFGSHLGAFIKVGRRTAYPLKLVRAEEDFRDRVVLLGNAAHAIHPVGAQGFNLGLRDVAVLAEILADHDNGDPGELGLLRRYSRWRAPDQKAVITFSDGITRLFAHPSLLAKGLRTGGLMACAWLPGLRRRQAVKAMGYRGRIPRLALGERLGVR